MSRKYFVEETNPYRRIFLEELEPVVEGYICITTPILSEKPVRFYEHFAYQHITRKPIIDRFVCCYDFMEKNIFGEDIPAKYLSPDDINFDIWTDREIAYANFKDFRDWYWRMGDNITSWSVIKVSVDRELIRNVYRQLEYYNGRAWPLVITAPDVYCLKYEMHGIGCRPDITENEEAIEKWNSTSFGKTDSKKLKHQKKV